MLTTLRRYKGRRQFQILEHASSGERGDEILWALLWEGCSRAAPAPENEAVLGCGASAEGRLEQPLGFSLCISTSTPSKCSHNCTYIAWQFHENIFIVLVRQQKIPVSLDLWVMVSCFLKNLCAPLPLSFKQEVIESGCKSLEMKPNHSHQPDIVFSPHQDLWGQLFPIFITAGVWIHSP